MMMLMLKGGPLMWVIALLGLIALLVFLERLLLYHRSQIHALDFASGVRNALRRGNIPEALAICDETAGPVALVIKTIVKLHQLPLNEIREAVQEFGRAEVARLEKRLVVLATIAQIAPLIGFLGTVMGMIQMFREIQDKVLPSPGQLAGGVWVALLTTAAGLVIAVPSYVGYNYLVSRVQQLVLDMEKAANEILNYLSGRDDTSAAPPS
ncbi:MAG: MotA/TolQ/ExbB proton channel family protein [Verrucomicrobia bacterium]|nr:MotA/TolQ/ExbB proton channel family protein [Verrucomicrobiota bacterium]